MSSRCLKPRKAKRETLSYLESSLASSPDREGVANIVRELRYEAASVATDKQGSALVEGIARLASPRCVERLCRWCSPYAGFLARHRHSSHVLQTLLAVLAKSSSVESSESSSESEDEGESSVWRNLAACGRGARCGIALWRALREEATTTELFMDGSASHVARAATSALAGLPVVSERRGRRSERHAHCIDDAAHLDREALRKMCAERKDEAGAAELGAIVRSLSADVDGLSRCALDASGAPSLALLVRVLGIAGETEMIHALAATLMRPADAVARLSNDKKGSVVVEALLETTSPPEPLLEAIAARLPEFVAGVTSNYVVQAAFRHGHAGEAWFRALPADRVRRADRLGVLSAALEAAARDRILVDNLLPQTWEVLFDAKNDAIREHGARAAAAALELARDRVVLPRDALYVVVRDANLPWNRALLDALLADGDGASLLARAVAAGDVRALVADRETAFLRLFRRVRSNDRAALLEPLEPALKDLQNRAPALVTATRLDLFCSSRKKWASACDREADAHRKTRPLPSQKKAETLDATRDRLLKRVSKGKTVADLLPAIVDEQGGEGKSLRSLKEKKRRRADFRDPNGGGEKKNKKKKKKTSGE